MIEAPYGHDCFLLEEARQTPIIREFLGEPSPADADADADNGAAGVAGE